MPSRPGAGISERVFRLFDFIRQVLKCSQGPFYRSRDRGREVRSYTMSVKQTLHRRERCRVRLHHIASGPAMDVHVDEPGHEHCVAEVNHAMALRNFSRLPRTDAGHQTIFDPNHRTIHPFDRAIESSG